MTTFLECYGLALVSQQYAMDRLASHHQSTFLCGEGDGATKHLLVFNSNDLGDLSDGRPLWPFAIHDGVCGFADANGERLIRARGGTRRKNGHSSL